MAREKSKKSVQPRRDFIKAGTAAVAAAGIASSTPSLSIARSAHAAGSETVKVGLIGIGGRGKGAANNAMKNTLGNVNLVAVADVFEHKIEKGLEQLTAGNGDRVQVPEANRFVGFDAYDLSLIHISEPTRPY